MRKPTVIAGGSRAAAAPFASKQPSQGSSPPLHFRHSSNPPQWPAGGLSVHPAGSSFGSPSWELARSTRAGLFEAGGDATDLDGQPFGGGAFLRDGERFLVRRAIDEKKTADHFFGF